MKRRKTNDLLIGAKSNCGGEKKTEKVIEEFSIKVVGQRIGRKLYRSGKVDAYKTLSLGLMLKSICKEDTDQRETKERK